MASQADVIYVDAIGDYTNPATGKGWTPREEAIIAEIMAKESFTRMGAIQAMRRRKLDDLQGKIRLVRATAIGRMTRFQGIRGTRKATVGGVGAINQDIRVTSPLETPQTGSPVGRLMVRILEKNPGMDSETARDQAHSLLWQAAGSKHYKTPQPLSEEQKQAARERLAAMRKAA